MICGDFLMETMEDGFDHETFLVLKDVYGELENPRVIALLKQIAEKNLYLDHYYGNRFHRLRCASDSKGT